MGLSAGGGGKGGAASSERLATEHEVCCGVPLPQRAWKARKEVGDSNLFCSTLDEGVSPMGPRRTHVTTVPLLPSYDSATRAAVKVAGFGDQVKPTHRHHMRQRKHVHVVSCTWQQQTDTEAALDTQECLDDRPPDSKRGHHPLLPIRRALRDLVDADRQVRGSGSHPAGWAGEGEAQSGLRLRLLV